MFGGGNGKIILGIIMLVVAMLMFGIILDSIDGILAWTGTGAATLADFSGMETLVSITPLLLWIGLLAGGGWLTFSGFRGKSSGKSGKGGGKKH